MAYAVGSMVGSLLSKAIDIEIQNSRQRAAIARWNSPLSRLGRCGIFSLRGRNARVDTVNTIVAAGMSTWDTAHGVRLASIDVEQILIFGSGVAAVVETVIEEDYIGAVRRADAGSWALSARLGPGFPVHTFVCRADNSEPREVPGPSGSPVTVAGLPWLDGSLRRRLGYDPLATRAPDEVRPLVEAAQWRAGEQSDLAGDALWWLPPQQWWSIQDLYLDDGHPGAVDLVVAGPSGVFAIDFSMTCDEASIARVSLHASRLRAYLPHVEVLPMIVSESATDARSGSKDRAGYPIPCVKPGQALGFIRGIRRRGLMPSEIATLNSPNPGWGRQVAIGPNGVPDTYYQWV